MRQTSQISKLTSVSASLAAGLVLAMTSFSGIVSAADAATAAAPMAEAAANRSVAGMRIGVIKQLTGAGFQPGVQARAGRRRLDRLSLE